MPNPRRREPPKAVQASLRLAAQRCIARGGRLTPQRAEVLALLLERRHATSAYDLLDALSNRLKRRVSPPTIYRALEFLVHIGLVAKVESQNAFVACRHIEHPHDHLLLLCRACNQAREIHEPAIEKALGDAARRTGFVAENRVIEIQGLCQSCSSKGA